MHVGVVAAILVFARSVNHPPREETPAERAYRRCGDCGLDRARVDRLIDDASHSMLDRDGLSALFQATFKGDDDDRELCRPCIEAVLDAAKAL